MGSVFVYGSLMFDPVWGRVVEGRYLSFPALAWDYVRLAVPGETYPAAVSRQGSCIQGMVWQDLSHSDIERLDAFEGKEYRRVRVEVTPVSCAGVERQNPSTYPAWIYVWNQVELLDNNKLWDLERFKSVGLPQFLERHVSGWEQNGVRK